jgi:hypothetical protein
MSFFIAATLLSRAVLHVPKIERSANRFAQQGFLLTPENPSDLE